MKIKLNWKKIRIPFYIIISLIIVIGIGFYFVKINKNYSLGNLKIKIGEYKYLKNTITDQEVIRKKINGQSVDSEEQADFLPVSVMVENSIDSWPQAGIDQADLVYEALVESSITRFLLIYATDQEIEKIGPVRSARPYYLDWALSYGAPYLHCGGSPEALSLIPEYGIKDVNEFYHPYFWRSNGRYAPHNTYTSSELINKMITDRGYDEIENYRTWQYKNDALVEERPDDYTIIVSYSNGGSYDVRWEYDQENNNYLRWQGNKAHKMENGTQLSAKNIIVMEQLSVVLDDEGRRSIQTVGQGKCWVFRDGVKVEGKWVKESLFQRELFFDQYDNEIQLNGGQTWIMSIPNENYLK